MKSSNTDTFTFTLLIFHSKLQPPPFHSLLFILFGFTLLCTTGCVTQKGLVYLNDGDLLSDTTSVRQLNAYSNQVLQKYSIRPYDNLIIRVNTFEGSTVNFFNDQFSSADIAGINAQSLAASLALNSYTVDSSGQVQIPLLGPVLVAGLTVAEIKTLIDTKLTPFIKQPSSVVRLSNFRITVLGEVNTPGVVYIFNDKTSLMEALGLAGDLTDFANRKKIKLIRDYGQESKAVYLNLTLPEFLSSDYYYVFPNDLIYVEPAKAKAFDINSRSVSIVLSAVSVATLLANVIFSIRRN